MNNAQQKESHIALGDKSFLMLMAIIQSLLDLVDFYMNRFPADTPSGRIKHEQLDLAVKTFGTLPYQLASVIGKWKKGEERLLSQMGVELDLLNELQATIDSTILFLDREQIDTSNVGHAESQEAIATLIRVNRVLN